MMFWIAAAALTASSPAQGTQPRVSVEAIATVRILSGVRLRLDSPTNRDAPRAHDTIVITDGNRRPAKLIEFE
jgi:hypothetical protein